MAVATVPEAVAGLAPVDAEQEDDEPGVQCESEADEGTAEDVAAVPVMSAALVPADPVPMAAAAVEPALVEADEHGARLVASVGEEVRGEPGVRVEANVHGEVAEEGTVAANVETVVEVPSGEDALDIFEERQLRRGVWFDIKENKRRNIILENGPGPAESRRSQSSRAMALHCARH